MRLFRPATAAAFFFIGLLGFAPAGCGPSQTEEDAALAARAAQLDVQADRDLEETLAVLDEAEAAMRTPAPAPALIYDAFRGEAIGGETGEPVGAPAPTAVVDTGAR